MVDYEREVYKVLTVYECMAIQYLALNPFAQYDSKSALRHCARLGEKISCEPRVK